MYTAGNLGRSIGMGFLVTFVYVASFMLVSWIAFLNLPEKYLFVLNPGWSELVMWAISAAYLYWDGNEGVFTAMWYGAGAGAAIAFSAFVFPDLLIKALERGFVMPVR